MGDGSPSGPHWRGHGSWLATPEGCRLQQDRLRTDPTTAPACPPTRRSPHPSARSASEVAFCTVMVCVALGNTLLLAVKVMV